MSGLKPAKQPRLMNQSQVQRTQSVGLLDASANTIEEAASCRRTVTPHLPTNGTEGKPAAPSHPKGHKVKNLSEVWKNMDQQDFLHLTDTIPLSDVWVQPMSVEEASGLYTTVSFLQVIAAPHFKARVANAKMSIEDLMKMLYLNDVLQISMQGVEEISYDTWLAEKTAAFIKANGVDDSTNRSKIANFVITADRGFTFYPAFIRNVGMFFRKICYHSYKEDGEKVEKVNNPSVIKCVATRGKFEYIIEARLLPLPTEWWDYVKNLTPETVGEGGPLA